MPQRAAKDVKQKSVHTGAAPPAAADSCAGHAVPAGIQVESPEVWTGRAGLPDNSPCAERQMLDGESSTSGSLA
jgi:hypothetical protein